MLRRAAIPGVIVVLVIAAAIVMFTDTSDQKTLTAYFPRTVSVYEGSDVRVLGVSVGKIDKVEPEGTRVKVTLHYDDDVKVPSDAKAVIISPSIVGDRYIQLTPAYTEGETLADDAVLEEDRTAVPLELDEIYANIDELTVALGPTGANKDGALSDLLETTAENFSGQGPKFQQTIKDFGTLSQTLADNKDELFGSTERLGEFVRTLAKNDGTVRAFNRSLSDVSSLLAGERDELAASLANLGEALDQVGGFVSENRAALGRNIHGLSRVAKVLVKQRKALDEILRVGPLALNNEALTYNPDTGTLDTNANLGNLAHELQTNPGLVLCAITQATDELFDDKLCKNLFSLLDGKGKNRVAPFGALGTGETSGGRFDPTLNGLVAP